MRDLITGAVRTGVQAFVTFAVAWLASVNIAVDENALKMVLTALAVGVVTLVLNGLQKKWPWLATVFSLGLSKSTPSY